MQKKNRVTARFSSNHAVFAKAEREGFEPSNFIEICRIYAFFGMLS